MAGSANNIQISPVQVLWRIEASEQVDFTGLTGADVAGKYITLNSAKDSVSYYAWFDNGVAADPAPGGLTEINVAVNDVDNPEQLAIAFSTAVGGTSGFDGSPSGNVSTTNRTSFGSVTASADVDSTAVVTMCRNGKDFDLGLLDGDVELSLAPANFIVTAHQTGVTPRAALFQGLESLEASTTMLETQTSQLKEIYGQYGETFNPGTSEVLGIGTSKQGQNILVDAARLVLKPVTATNDDDNTTLMLASPLPESLVFSGENPRTLSVTWQGFIDDQIDDRASAFVIGNEVQAGLRK